MATTLLDKLGIKPGVHVAVLGDLEEAFLDRVHEVAEEVIGGLPTPATEVLLLAISQAKELAAIAKIAAGLRPEAALWVVYLRGADDPSQADVRRAGRAAGLKDIKLVRFSESHTAFRFVRTA